MKNNRGVDAPLGPRPSVPRRPLSASRSAILERLRDQPEPVTQSALVLATGRHPNTVREHLEGLVGAGLVRRFPAEPQGRGRPAWLYEAVGDAGSADSEYAGLAAALAATIARTSPRPREDAAVAGEAWGHELVRDRAETAADPEEARSRVVAMLDDLGFSPHQDADDPAQVRLTRCPLLAAAHRHPDVVCGVHLGIVRGALDEHGFPSDASALAPFSEPGSCLLTIPPVSGAAEEER